MTTSYELVVKGGTIADATSAAPFAGDLTIDGDRITEIGGRVTGGCEAPIGDGYLPVPSRSTSHLNSGLVEAVADVSRREK